METWKEGMRKAEKEPVEGPLSLPSTSLLGTEKHASSFSQQKITPLPPPHSSPHPHPLHLLPTSSSAEEVPTYLIGQMSGPDPCCYSPVGRNHQTLNSPVCSNVHLMHRDENKRLPNAKAAPPSQLAVGAGT